MDELFAVFEKPAAAHPRPHHVVLEDPAVRLPHPAETEALRQEVAALRRQLAELQQGNQQAGASPFTVIYHGASRQEQMALEDIIETLLASRPLGSGDAGPSDSAEADWTATTYHPRWCVDRIHPGVHRASRSSRYYDPPASSDAHTYERATDSVMPFSDDAFAESDQRVCFNCDKPGHTVANCPEPHNEEIQRRTRNEHNARRRSMAGNDIRYHAAEKQTAFRGFQPGVLSAQLRAAMGIGSSDYPPYYQGLMNWGYPPGYVAPVEGALDTSLSMYNDARDATQAAPHPAPHPAHPGVPFPVGHTDRMFLVRYPGLPTPVGLRDGSELGPGARSAQPVDMQIDDEMGETSTTPSTARVRTAPPLTPVVFPPTPWSNAAEGLGDAPTESTGRWRSIKTLLQAPADDAMAQ